MENRAEVSNRQNMVFKQPVSIANDFYYHRIVSRCIRPASSTPSRHCQVSNPVSQSTICNIWYCCSLQKGDLKEAPSCYLNKRGSHRDRNNPAMEYYPALQPTLPRSDYYETISSCRHNLVGKCKSRIPSPNHFCMCKVFRHLQW